MNEREKMTLMDDSSLVGPEGITLYKMDAQAHRLPFIPKTKTFPFLPAFNYDIGQDQAKNELRKALLSTDAGPCCILGR